MPDQLTAWENRQDSRYNREMELDDALDEMTDEELEEWKKSPCRRCNGKKRNRCQDCEV